MSVFTTELRRRVKGQCPCPFIYGFDAVTLGRASAALLAFALVWTISVEGNCQETLNDAPHQDAVELPGIGLVVTDVTPLMARLAGLDQVKGCFVKSVASGTSAESAGIELGDIIVSFNDRGIRNAAELRNDLAGAEPGEVAKMCVVREDYRTTLYVVVAEDPPDSGKVSRNPGWLGVEVIEVTPESRESFLLEEAGKEGGALVQDVVDGSPADKAGIQPGDVIMSFNSRKVRTVKELTTDLDGTTAGDTVRICIMRGNIRKTLYPVLTERTRSYQLASYEESGSGSDGRDSQLAALYPAASRFERQLQPVPHYRVYGESNNFLGVAFITTEVCPEESEGYQGPISILVGLSTEGKIVNLLVLYHSESVKYTRGHLDRFLEQYVNKNIKEPLVLGKDIDVMTGATVTSSAINRSIDVGSAIVLTAVLDVERIYTNDTFGDSFSWDLILWQTDSVLLLLIAAFALAAYYRRNETMRFFVLGLSLLYLGWIKGGGFSIYDIINVLQGDFPVMSNTLYWYMLLGFIALTSLFIGRFYCGWLCPFGGLTEMMYRAFPNLDFSVPLYVDRWLRLLKYLLLLVILLLTFFADKWQKTSSVIDTIEPFGTFFQLQGELVMWLFLGIFLSFSLFISRAYCKYICPLGAFFAVVTIATSFLQRAVFGKTVSERHPKPVMSTKSCPVNAIRHAKYHTEMRINNTECIVCSRRSF